MEAGIGWTEWLGVVFGIFLFRYTVSYRKRAEKVSAADNLKTQTDRVWTPPPDTGRKYTRARHTEYPGTSNESYHGL